MSMRNSLEVNESVVTRQGVWVGRTWIALANRADATGGILVSRDLPPDGPPKESYQVWPGVFVPPFHYRNPVSGRE